MSKIDGLYKNAVEKVMNSKESYSYEDVNRPGVQVRQHRNLILSYGFYDGVPLLTLKKTELKIAVAELAWMLSGSTNIKELHNAKVYIWHKDALNYYNRVIGGANPLTMKQFKAKLDKDPNFMGNLGIVYGWFINGRQNSEGFTAISKLIHLLSNKPNSREKLISMSNHLDSLEDKAISTCHHYFEVTNLTDNLGVLNFNIRSSDVFLGLPYNILFYYLIADLLTELTGFKIVGMQGSISNAHIYHDHFEAAEELLTRDEEKIAKLDAKVHKDYYKYFDAVIQEQNVNNSVSNLTDILANLHKLFILNHTQSFGKIEAEMIPYGV